MNGWTRMLPLLAGAMLAACGGPATDNRATDNRATGDAGALEGKGVSLRNLGETDVTAPAPQQFTVQGRLIPTPSDTQSRYYLLRGRAAVGGTTIAIIRQEHAGRVAYARTEVDCARRLFHVLGVAPNRALVETEQAYDGPLRPIAGLPLRQELATYVCQSAGTPLAAA